MLGKDSTGTLEKLPGHEQTPPPSPSVCPADRAGEDFAVSAIEAKLPMLGGETGKLYVLDADRATVVAGQKPPTRVLHASVGDCLHVQLTNRTSSGRGHLPLRPAGG